MKKKFARSISKVLIIFMLVDMLIFIPQQPVQAIETCSVPGAPTEVSAIAGDGQAIVNFTAPEYNGGSVITGYTVIAKPEIVPAPEPISGGIQIATSSSVIENMLVYDGENASDWHLRSNLNEGNFIYGDRGYKTVSLPKTVQGCDYIQAANDSKNHRENRLVDFKAKVDCEVYLAHDDRIKIKPEWMSSWMDTEDEIKGSQVNPSVVYSLYKKSFAAGSVISLGNNGGSTNFYIAIIKQISKEITTTGTASPIPITGLTNGTSYTFIVKAINKIGAGAESAPSNPTTFPIIPITPPKAPTEVSAIAGDGQAIVSFTAPESNGGSAITGYTVIAKPKLVPAPEPISDGIQIATSSSIIENMLVYDDENASDWHLRSNLNEGNFIYGDRGYKSVSLPKIVQGCDYIQAANDSKNYTGNRVVDFKAKVDCEVYLAHDNRIKIKPEWMANWMDTEYEIKGSQINPNVVYSLYKKSFAAGSVISLGNNGGRTNFYIAIIKRISKEITETGTASPITITGLTNGTSYTFTVKAINKMGAGAESVPSDPITLVADTILPTPPTNINATNVSGTKCTLTWLPSTDNIEIVRYEIFLNGNYEGSTPEGASYELIGLIPNMTYKVVVKSVDSSNNTSLPSTEYTLITKVTTVDEMKLALISNFKVKGTTYTISYSGDITNINNNIDIALQNAVKESKEPFMLQDVSISFNGVAGNMNIKFEFVYDNTTIYNFVVQTPEEFKQKVKNSLNNRDLKINLIYKGETLNTTIDNIIILTFDSIFKEDTYLKSCVTNYKYSTFSNLGIIAVKIDVNYDATKSEQEYIDKESEGFVNGNFTNGKLPWGIYYDASTKANAQLDILNGEAKVTVDNEGVNFGNISFYQNDIALTQGETYTLSFDARSSIDRDIKISFQNSSNYSVYFIEQASLTSTTKNYLYKFTMNNTTDLDTSFYFGVGLVENRVGVMHDIYIDNVVLTKTTNASSDTEKPFAPTGLQAINTTSTSTTLTWNAPIDNNGIETYTIVADGIFAGSTSGETTYTLNNLDPNRTYEFYVVASDKQNNISSSSNICTITTPVSNAEELKRALIRNFIIKGTECTLIYTGDTTNINNDLSTALTNAVTESSFAFMIKDSSYDISEISGNLKITYNFTYNNTKYLKAVRSIYELKHTLRSAFNNRNEDVNIIYKGSISTNEVIGSINSLMDEDTYLKLLIEKHSCLTEQSFGVTSIILDVQYTLTVEQSKYVDETVNFIVSNLITDSMSDDEKEKLIHDYILSRVTYTNNSNYTNEYDALYYGKAKCEGYAMLTHKMLKAAGIYNVIVTNKAHAWNLVNINNNWYHLDVTWNDGKRKDDGFYKYYNITDSELLKTRDYINITGITATSNYIDKLTTLNNNNNGKYSKILKDIKKNTQYIEMNIFKSNSSLDLEYNEIVLKEGEQISLINSKMPKGFYDNTYVWRSSNSEIAEINNGVITAKKSGKITIAAVEMYSSILNNNLFATVQVVPSTSQDGKTLQSLPKDNYVGFSNLDVTPNITINSSEDVISTTTVTNCSDNLERKIKYIGEPIDLTTTSKFDWADISFILSQKQLDTVDINNLVIYWYDEETNTFIPQATKVNLSTKTLRTTVTHFSKYFIAEKDYKPLDIAFVIDSYYGDKESLNIFKVNIANTLNELRKYTTVRIALVDNNGSNMIRYIYDKNSSPTNLDIDLLRNLVELT